MTFLVSMAPVVVALVAGAGIGRWLERTRRPVPVRPICACDHSYGEHAGDGVCQAETARKRYDRRGSWTGYDYVPCACRRYTGPEPVTELWTPPLI